MGKKILIVEDDPDLQVIFRSLLTRGGYEVVVLADGRQLTEAAAPDLYIMDIELPYINGLDLCRQLKAHDRFRHVPVLIASANDSLRSMAREVCADDAIAKPFEAPDLLERVGKLIGA